jgi:molybdenum cofactor cytidylyltransferase
MRRDCAVLILAAGSSRRLGRPKALVSLGGRTLLERAVGVAIELDPGWIGVVVGSGASRLVTTLRRLPVAVIHARRWRQGLGASLRSGLRAVPPGYGRALVLTVDQWAVRPRHLKGLLEAARRGPVASAYAGTQGVPAIVPTAWARSLGNDRSDSGARSLLRSSGAPAIPLEAAAHDLDTVDQLRALQRRARRKLFFM